MHMHECVDQKNEDGLRESWGLRENIGAGKRLRVLEVVSHRKANIFAQTNNLSNIRSAYIIFLNLNLVYFT